VPSLYVLLARSHHENAPEGSGGEVEPEHPRAPELVPEFAEA
jgi:hypothetical protein